MSSPSYSLFDFPSRHTPFRNRSHASALLALHQQHGRGPTRSNAIHRKRRTFKDDITAFAERQSHGPPSYPDYLQGTVYAKLVHEQHALYCKKFGKHRNGPVADLVEVAPDSFVAALITHDLRLPTAWNPNDKGEFVDISEDCMELTYKGAGKDDADISAVRSNFPFRPQCGLFYFEVEIISKGVDGHIGIGFCWSNSTLDRLPGWEEHTWGYHGDDGHLFSGPGTSRPYGPKFGTGDVIGCGFDFRTMSAFYTKNGVYLGTAFQNISIGRGIYPFVGFKTPGEKIRANFGSHPFKFDIAHHYKDQSRQSFAPITQLSRPKNEEFNTILEYLLHNGYSQSASAFKRSITCPQLLDNNNNNSMDVDNDKEAEAATRRDIRLALLRGNIDEAIDICNSHYPGVLDDNEIIRFRLACRKFIEMVHRIHKDAIDTMDIDDSTTTKRHAGVKRRRSIAEAKNNDTMDESSSSSSSSTEDTNDQQLESVMAYGKEIQQTYANLVENDPELKKELTATFSALAYVDVKNSAVSYLFDSSHLEKLASDLNAAILVSQKRYPTTSLERLYRQTAAVINDLVLAGNSHAAMLEPERLLPRKE